MASLKNIKTRSIFFKLGAALLFAWLIESWFLIDFILAWAFAINIVTFITFGQDKAAAQMGWTRTPEITLLTLGVLGGFPALFTGFNVFNHKTKKPSFFVPMWILFIIQILAGAWFYGNLDEVYQQWAKKQQEAVSAPPSEKPSLK